MTLHKITENCEYLKIDTTVPPGNEAKGAKYLKSVLEKHGIEAKLFETAKNRSIVYGRWENTLSLTSK